MNILLIGSGGREHAIAKKFSQNNNVKKIYCAPGNGGMHIEKKCENINIESIEDLLMFAKENNIDLTFVGPEKPLVEGIVDIFTKEGLKIFGPNQKGAQLEGSKSFSKDFMSKYGVKTAKYAVFTNYDQALKYIEKEEYPIVIKADGLASGKGVYICQTVSKAKNSIKEIMIDNIFDGAGSKIVVEEYLEGVEASILSITDGETIIPFISAKDHKQIFDGGLGPNTGGMGVISPNPFYTKDIEDNFTNNIMMPTLHGIKEEFSNFCGIIFFGIMITAKGTYLLEYNVRLGDPETQSVLELMQNDFFDLVQSAINKNLSEFKMSWKDEYSCNVVLASEGYPGKIKTGYEIKLVDGLKDIYIAGAKCSNNILYTSSGRVASVVGRGKSLDEAINNAYKRIGKIDFKGKHMRGDIGK